MCDQAGRQAKAETKNEKKENETLRQQNCPSDTKRHLLFLGLAH
jgi:hypothetical protein